MNAIQFLQDMAIVLSTAAAVLIIFRKLKQPPVLGYLAAGVLIGPHTTPIPLIADLGSLEALAQIGVVFLLFALGVEFNLSRLAKIGVKALICAAIEALAMISFGYFIGSLMGWGGMDSLLLGSVIALASTAIVARTLLDSGRRAGGWEDLASGTLIAEDVIAVLLITLFSSAAQLGDFQVTTLISAQMRLAMFVTLILVMGRLVFPRL